jgi:hypothetical protein
MVGPTYGHFVAKFPSIKLIKHIDLEVCIQYVEPTHVDAHECVVHPKKLGVEAIPIEQP